MARVKLLLIYLITVTALFALPTFTQEEERFIADSKPITIGLLNSYIPFTFIQNNKQVGFTHDLIKLISKRSGLKFQKLSGTWPEIYGQFKNGELDMISELSYKKERLSFAAYTNPYYEVPIGIFTRDDFREYGGLESLRGKSLGILKNSYIIDIIRQIDGIEVKEFPSSESKFYALSNGKVDAVLNNTMGIYNLESMLLKNIKLSGIFNVEGAAKEDLRFGINKSNPVLVSIINKTLDSISFAEISQLSSRWILDPRHGDSKLTKVLDSLTPEDVKRLNSKLFGEVQNMNVRSISLNEEEKSYLRQKRVIKMCIDPDWMPFESNVDGKHIGMSADYFKIIESAIGYPIEMVSTRTWTESLEVGKSRGCDIFSLVMETEDRKKYLNFTKTYFETPLVLATKIESKTIDNINDALDKKLGISAGYAFVEILREKYPGIQLVEVKNIHDGMVKVEKGEIYGFIGTLASVGYHIQKEHIGLIKIAGKFEERWRLGIGTRNDEPLLNTIFDKAIEMIQAEDHQNILNKWVSVSYDAKEEKNSLTNEEKVFLQKHPKVRFRIRPDRPPFEFVEDGKVSGIAVDYLKISAEKVGMNIELVVDDKPIKEAYDEVEKRREKFDTLLFTVKNKQRAKRFAFGDAYLSYPMMIITHKDSGYIGSTKDLNNKAVVIEKGFLTNKWLKRDYPDIKIINVPNTKEALEYVNSGRAYAYIGNMAVANHMSIFGGMENIKVAAPSDYGNISYRFVAPKEWPELTSILSKGFRQITPSEHSALQQKWFSLQVVERFDYKLLWEILAVLGFVIVWIIVWNRKLEVRVKEGIEKFKKQEAILIQQSKMASMGEMINNIAHQWKQPLNSVAIYAQEIGDIVEYDNGDKERLKSVEKGILRQVDQMNSTINDFRNFFKPSGIQEHFNGCSAIKDVMVLIGGRLKKSTVEFKMAESDCFEVYGSESEFKQVLLNILNNSCDAFENRGNNNNQIEVLFAREGKKSIIIRDNGGGIPKALLPKKLFDSYVTTKGDKGTGIGLHMSQVIIEEKFRGEITVANYGSGAEFTILLPLFEEEL